MTPVEADLYHRAYIRHGRGHKDTLRKGWTEAKVARAWDKLDQKWEKEEKIRKVRVKLHLKDLKKKVDSGKFKCPHCDGSCMLQIHMPITQKR